MLVQRDVVEVAPDQVGTFRGTSTVISGTGALAAVRGHGTFEGTFDLTGAMTGTYSGLTVVSP